MLASLLVSIGRPRLLRLGFDVPPPIVGRPDRLSACPQVRDSPRDEVSSGQMFNLVHNTQCSVGER